MSAPTKHRQRRSSSEGRDNTRSRRPTAGTRLSPRSGFVCLIGRPNVGKSTLLNALLKFHAAIVSPKPQTTRQRILGVVTVPAGQLILVDTPGVQKRTGALARAMRQSTNTSARDADVVVVVAALDERIGNRSPAAMVHDADREVIRLAVALGKPLVLVLNKIDLVPKPVILPVIGAYRDVAPWRAIVPMSALNSDGLDALINELVGAVPEGPALFDEEMVTDQTERALTAEYVREQVLRYCREEVPHAVAVVVDEFDETERGETTGIVRIAASIIAERETQKAILIGRKGAMLKSIGTAARKSIERMLGSHVYLKLQVRVEAGWTERADAVARMGYRHER